MFNWSLSRLAVAVIVAVVGVGAAENAHGILLQLLITVAAGTAGAYILFFRGQS